MLTGKLVEFQGETKTVKEWANNIGIQPGALYRRLKSWPLEQAIKTPRAPRNKLSKPVRFEFAKDSDGNPVKSCTVCKCLKSITLFRKSSKPCWTRKGDGLRSQCNSCLKERNNRYRSRIPREEMLARQKRYYHQVMYENPAVILYGAAKQRSKLFKIPFEIDVEFIRIKLNAGICELTGWPVDINAPLRSFYRPSLDQIIPRAGYTRENTRLVCWGVNWMLGKFGVDKFIAIADAIRSHTFNQTALRVDSLSGS